jgi:hypothetical protein
MKKEISFFLVVSFVGFLSGYILSNSASFGICASNAYECRDLFNRIGDPLLYGMGALSLVFVILLFFTRAVSAWKKFAGWFIPLAAILFAVYPQPGAWDFLSPDPETLFKWISISYVVISVAIIVGVALKSAKT